MATILHFIAGVVQPPCQLCMLASIYYYLGLVHEGLGDTARNFALVPSNRFLRMANHYSDEVAVLPILSGLNAGGAPIAVACQLLAPLNPMVSNSRGCDE